MYIMILIKIKSRCRGVVGKSLGLSIEVKSQRLFAIMTFVQGAVTYYVCHLQLIKSR